MKVGVRGRLRPKPSPKPSPKLAYPKPTLMKDELRTIWCAPPRAGCASCSWWAARRSGPSRGLEGGATFTWRGLDRQGQGDRVGKVGAGVGWGRGRGGGKGRVR